jgi:hypothetical protein
MTFAHSPPNASGQTELPLMQSAAASPAKTYLAPENKPDLMANAAVFGPKSRAWLASYDRASSSWKTSQTCFLATGEIGLAAYSGTWPRSGMMRSGIAYRLPTLARLTFVIGRGLLPTPVKYDATPGGPGNHYQGLGWMARHRWPTPTASRRSGLQSHGKNALLGLLNPRWVEWLMGFPHEWCSLKLPPSEMP